MRGEKASLGLLRLPPVGSPPHARGKDDMEKEALIDLRITPACAGKRSRGAMNILM